MTELKPCPFCGGAAKTDTLSTYRTEVEVYCNGCSACVSMLFPLQQNAQSALDTVAA